MMERKQLVSLVECPRDAMQGWSKIIPTSTKVAYLDQLLKVGFDVLDCGSFVSAKAIPQMADTAEVLMQLKPSATKLLVIVANKRGAERAVSFGQVAYLGFPFSISPSFQLRNTNSTIEESWVRVLEIQELCRQHNKKLVIYISMGFGNPYNDPYNPNVIAEWIDKMKQIGINTFSLADTVGVATPELVHDITHATIKNFPGQTIGVHLHSTAANWKAKLEAATAAGCKRFDGALKGVGGCPMANDALVGNMDMELMIDYFQQQQLLKELNSEALLKASDIAADIFTA